MDKAKAYGLKTYTDWIDGSCQLTVKGTAAPTSQGGFCALPACCLTGAPHIGHVISGT